MKHLEDSKNKDLHVNFEDENQNKEFRIIVFGDSKGKDKGVNKKVLHKIMKRVKKLNPKPQYMVVLGDSIAGHSNIEIMKTQLDTFSDLIKDYNFFDEIIPVIGNHEVNNEPEDYSKETIFIENFPNLNVGEFLDGYNKTVYYLDVFNTRIIVLNTYHFGEINKICGSQLEWFKKVTADPIKNKIVFLHSPAYPTGAHLGTSLDFYTKERNEFWSVIDSSNVDIVFSGHEHNYSRRVINRLFNTSEYKFKNDIQQVITGGGGEKLRNGYKSKSGVVVPPKAVHHFVIIDFDFNNIKLQAITAKGEIIDKLIIEK
ncbi:metallophosphoesterase [Clostridium sp. DJ247]|uniref:metallophosphoesterase family protein n=1 Tax=Clostridium sp. DJ247 TaxID=2726188 RepID=UPI001625170A|nr:metallophosphoesterase [Clostridium sp. DJ247]MBC2581186.1 calcineurin [Clostridium sp. DJ247]